MYTERITDLKRRQLVLSAKELFWKYGFKKVSIEEVCREAGVSKMTFYKHFANKTELVRFMLSFIIEESLDRFYKIMESDIPFTEKVKKQVELKREGIQGMSELFLEDWMNSDDPELIAYRQDMTGKSTAQIMEFYQKAQARGEIRKDIKLEFILYFINHMFLMIEDKNLKALYETPEDMIMELLNFFFYGISVHK